MAAPSRLRAALLLRNLAAASAAAVAAGHAAAPDWRAADGLSRGEAAALLDWGRALPGAALAYMNRGHPSHRELREVFDTLTYFATEHPQRPDGSPASWQEIGAPPLSPAMARYLADGAEVPIAELLPAEAAEFGEYLTALHGIEPGDAAVASVLPGLRARAAEEAPAPAASGDQAATAGDMTIDQAQARYHELAAAAASRTASPLDKRMWADEMAELAAAFPDLKPLAGADIAAARGRHEASLDGDHFSPRARDLHDELLAMGPRLHGTALYNARLAELQHELDAGPGGAASPPPPAAIAALPARTGPLDPAQLAADLKGLSGPARIAALEARFGPLSGGPAPPGA
jgi:hypothetical protein